MNEDEKESNSKLSKEKNNSKNSNINEKDSEINENDNIINTSKKILSQKFHLQIKKKKKWKIHQM